MMARRLGPEEQALWARVIATVRPMHGADPSQFLEDPTQTSPVGRSAPAIAPVRPRSSPAPSPSNTLDGNWDRILRRGLVQPDLTIDLHGHNLATAYERLDAGLEQAIALGARVILLITGKPPAEGRSPVTRGAIRAAMGDWLAASRHAGRIAAVRFAHSRHGGAGALYIILRRPEARHRQKS